MTQDGEPARLLIVDPREERQAALVSALRFAGLAVSHTPWLTEAVSLAAAVQPRVILLNLDPSAFEYELPKIRAARAAAPKGCACVALVEGADDRALDAFGTQAGLDTVLGWPTTASELFTAIASHLGEVDDRNPLWPLLGASAASTVNGPMNPDADSERPAPRAPRSPTR